MIERLQHWQGRGRRAHLEHFEDRVHLEQLEQARVWDLAQARVRH